MSLGSLESSTSHPVLWVTADVQGYLSGCYCPSGNSAGLPALAQWLNDERQEGDLLIDAGGFREPHRSDPLLEGILDQVALAMEYDALFPAASDLRDGWKAYKDRRNTLPLKAAGSILKKNLGIPITVKPQYSAFENVALMSWWARDEWKEEGRLQSLSVLESVRQWKKLEQQDFDWQVLLLRGGLEDLEQWLGALGEARQPDVVILSGALAPGASLDAGGVQGRVNDDIPWVSLAPRGNGVLKVDLSSSHPQLELSSLVRGESPESKVVLRWAGAYEEILADAAQKASGGSGCLGCDELQRVVAEQHRRRDFLELEYWYPFGCRSCERFLSRDVPRLEGQYLRDIRVLRYDSSLPQEFNELKERLDSMGISLNQLPLMISHHGVWQGDEEISQSLELTLSGLDAPERTPNASPQGMRWEPSAVFLAGLLDGVNPCAFSAMVFLVSALALAGGGRKRMLAVGLCYALGVFITYFAVGAGLLGGLRRITAQPAASLVLNILLIGVMLILAVLSALDGWRLSRGRQDLQLGLPKAWSARVRRILKRGAGASILGATGLGFVVALVELGCTGQVYLPSIAWMIDRGTEGVTPWLWLLLYNIAFIIPLLLIFVVSLKGVTATRLAQWFRKRGAHARYAMALLLLVLALVAAFV